MPDANNRPYIEDAPAFPVVASWVPLPEVEKAACLAVIADFEARGDSLRVGRLSDSAYRRLYRAVAPGVPAREHRGEGWEPFIESYMRIRDRIQVELELDEMRRDLEVDRVPAAAPAEDGYPSNWPRCSGCGRPAMDGHLTCGDARCDEGGRRR